MNKLFGALALVGAGIGLSGCSPALNWRSVALPEAGLQVALPCKPDAAQRTVELAGAPVALSMTGCRADGVQFAVSHAVLADPARLAVSLAHWRAASLARWGVQSSEHARDSAFVPTGALAVATSLRTVVQGRTEKGQPLQVQGVWFARTRGAQLHLYHAVLLGDRVRPETADTFFNGLVLQ